MTLYTPASVLTTKYNLDMDKIDIHTNNKLDAKLRYLLELNFPEINIVVILYMIYLNRGKLTMLYPVEI